MVRSNEDWLAQRKAEREEARLTRKMLECQFEKRNGKSENWAEIEPKCNECEYRFKCLTMHAKKFTILDEGIFWRSYVVFGVTDGEARDTFNRFMDEAGIVDEVDCGEDHTQTEIEECHE